MKTVVCITNNIVCDGRVQRVVKAASAVNDSVDVVCFPVPDRNFGVDRENIHPFFVDIDLNDAEIIDRYQKAIDELGLRKELIDICPFLNERWYQSDELGEKYDKWLNIRLRGNRWEPVRNHVSEDMKHADAMSYITVALIRMVIMARETVRHCADIVYCNDLETLICGVAHKKKYGSKIIYDVHDIAYDMSAGVFHKIYCGMLALLENKFIDYVDLLVSTGDNVLSWIKEFHGIEISSCAILNCVENFRREGIHPKKYLESNKDIVVYFHGNAYEARNIHLMVEALKDVDGIKLLIRSANNKYLDSVKELANKIGVDSKVEFVDMVPYKEAVRAANRDGDIGIFASSPDSCINWKYAMSIKFFEFLAAGLPVITTKAVDQLAIVEMYDCGFTLEECTVEAVAKVFREVIRNRNKLGEMSQNAIKATSDKLNLDIYEKKLESFFMPNGFEYYKENSGYKLLVNKTYCLLQDSCNKFWAKCYWSLGI